MVYRLVTMASFFLVRFWPFPSRSGGSASGGGAWLGVEGRHILRVLLHVGFERLDAQIQSEDPCDAVGRFTIGAIGGVIVGPLPQQVGIAAVGQTQGGVQRTAAWLPRRGEVMAREAQFAKDRVVGDQPLVVIGQQRAIRQRRCCGARGGARDEEQSQQRGAEGQQAPKQRYFDGVGGLRLGGWSGEVGEKRLKVLLDLLYNGRGVGRHGDTPVGQSMVGATDYPADHRVAQRQYIPHRLLPGRRVAAPRILVTLIRYIIALAINS